MRCAVALLALCAVIVGAPAWAEDNSRTIPISQSNVENAGQFQIDASIPVSPGFAAIGLEPTSVVDPSASRNAFADILSYVDENGDLKPGFALGGTPYWWFNTDKRLVDYQNDTVTRNWERILARTEISIGFADGGEGKQDRLGIGAQTELLGHSDYRLDHELYDCVIGGQPDQIALTEMRQQWRRAAIAQNTAHPEQAVDVIQYVADHEAAFMASFLPGRIEGCSDEAKKRYLTRDAWTVAGAFRLESQEGNFDNARSDGGSLWTAYRHPIGDENSAANYVTLFGRYDFDNRGLIEAAPEERSSRALVALVAGREAETWRATAQIGYNVVDHHNDAYDDQEYLTYNISFQHRLTGNVWLEAAYGHSDNPDFDRDEFVNISLRFATSAQD